MCDGEQSICYCISSETVTSSGESLQKVDVKAASAPACVLPAAEPSECQGPVTEVKKQLSAPSYFYCLGENDPPPYLRPEKEPKPCILIGSFMNQDEAIEMIAAADSDPFNGLKNFLGNFLVQKNIVANYDLLEKKFVTRLLMELIVYSAQRDFTANKLACLLTLYIKSHVYFKWYYWSPPAALWSYFKEILIRHTIEDSPHGEEVFEPEESYDILSHFHANYLSHLPLVHTLTFGSHRLKYMWPYNKR